MVVETVSKVNLSYEGKAGRKAPECAGLTERQSLRTDLRRQKGEVEL